MADPTLQELYTQLQNQEERSPAHEALLRAVSALESAAKPFRYFQRRKQLPLVKARDRNLLMGLHQNISTAAETLLAGEESPELKDMVRKLSALAANNYRALLTYDPSRNPKSLNSIEEASRTLTLHVGPDELQGAALGANLSERTALAFYDEQGNKINGVFTKKKTLEIVEPVFQAMREGVEAWVQDPQARADSLAALAALQSNLSVQGTLQGPSGRSLQFDGTPDNTVVNLLRLSSETTRNRETGKKTTKISAGYLQFVLRQLMKPEDFAKIDPNAFFGMAEKMTPLRNPISVNASSARIPAGGRLDNRNAAMSTVADLLGTSKLVCRSRPIKLVDANGVEQEGTFMELAQGLDIHNLSGGARFIDEMSLEGGGRGLRAIADLQVLDYICGNVDRHAANFTYQFTDCMKFNGVQGFDNDCSFGTLVPDGKSGENRLVGLDSLMAVSQQTYDRVQKLTPELLKYALRGYGLSEEELDAAGQRLTKLKDHLRTEKEFYQDYDRSNRGKKLLEGHVRILKDNEWSKYEAKDFYTTDRVDQNNNPVTIKNTFALACPHVRTMKVSYQKQQKAYVNLAKTIAVGIRNRAEASAPERERKKAEALNKLLSSRTWTGFSSPRYREMQAAVKAYADYQKQLQERLKQARQESEIRKSNYHRQKEAVITQEDLERLKALSENMRDKAQAYLDGKKPGGQLPANASDYTKQRVAAAEQVLAYGTQGAVIRPEERQQAADNLTRANAAIQQRNLIHAAEAPKTPVIGPL